MLIHYKQYTRSSSLPLLAVPNPSTVFARQAFNYTAPTTWNSLPADILTCDSESGCKRLLTRGQSNLTKSASLGPIPRLGVTPGGRNLYH